MATPENPESALNFWSHFPDGITFRDLQHLEPKTIETYLKEAVKPLEPIEPAMISVQDAQVLGGLTLNQVS